MAVDRRSVKSIVPQERYVPQEQPRRRGRPRVPRVSLSRDQVVQAALHVVETDGYAALSMRRVAQELGVGTMSLYWHVADRDELIGLLFDRAVSAQVLDEVPDDWREALRRIAFGARAVFERSPWLLDVGPRPKIGARVLRHIEQSIEATESMGLPLPVRFAAIAAVDSLVLGYVVQQHSRADDEPHLTPDAKRALADGAYPRYADLMTEGALARQAWIEAQDFEVGLEILLDGIAAAVERGRLSRPAVPPHAAPHRPGIIGG